MKDAVKSRLLLIFHPAGVFFALAAFTAAALPWLWLLSLEDPRLAHARLGLFGFAGTAICGYVLTAQKAWTGRQPPMPALFMAALALGARLTSLGFPRDLWPLMLLSLPVALMIPWPVFQARRWDKVPLAMVPLMLVAAEAWLLDRPDLAGLLPVAITTLVFIIGGRFVPSFVTEARRRRGRGALERPPLWLGSALLGAGLLQEGILGMLALIAAMLWVVVHSLDGLRLGQANRMLCLGYAGLVPGVLAIAAARSGMVPQLVEVHGLTMATIGPMILAVAARVTMRRPAGAELQPRRRHGGGLGLVFCAAVARVLAELPGQTPIWLTVAGIGWSAAWMLFLTAHLPALLKPAPFPVLSAMRYEAREPS